MINHEDTKQLTNLKFYRKRGDSIRRFKVEAIIVGNLSVTIVLESMTDCYLKLYLKSIAAIQCMLYSQMTVANMTQLKAVLSKENNICNILSKI